LFFYLIVVQLAKIMELRLWGLIVVTLASCVWGRTTRFSTPACMCIMGLGCSTCLSSSAGVKQPLAADLIVTLSLIVVSSSCGSSYYLGPYLLSSWAAYVCGLLSSFHLHLGMRAEEADMAIYDEHGI
jgi:hypothetical protein